MALNIIELIDRNTYVIGDLHGDTHMLTVRITNDEKMENCNLIIAGDIGLGFDKIADDLKTYKKLNKLLEKKNIMLYLVRGNHDDPSYFREHLINFSNVTTLEDYSVLSCKGVNILCVGGGLSIDRTYRIKKYQQRLHYMSHRHEGQINDAEILNKVRKLYWEDELPIFDEDKLNEIKENGLNITHIISHTSPSFAYPKDKYGIDYWLIMDFKLQADLDNERQIMTNIYNKVIDDGHNLQEWIYGHFHTHYEEIKDNAKFITLLNSDFTWDVHEINII